LLSLALLTAVACGAPDQPTREIVFTRASRSIGDSTVSLDVFAMQPNGTGLRQITHSAPDRAENNFPEASPDGRTIVFIASSRAPTARPELHLIDASGTNERVLAHFDSLSTLYPTYSRDGRHIAFSAAADPDSTGMLPAVLYVVDADGRNLKPLTQTPVGYGCPAWLPSGDGLLVTDSRLKGRSRILRVDYPSGATRTLIESDSLTFECAFPSPDGTRVALTAFAADPAPGAKAPRWMQPYQMSITGGDLRPFVEMAGYGKDPRWSRDGRAVVFLGSTAQGFFKLDPRTLLDSVEVFTADSEGRKLTRLTTNRVADIHPSW
jgi:Tol biopolymer transport system component